ncbi:MAG: GNAT family N-acyltransferase [Patescibacteria group bacterium]
MNRLSTIKNLVGVKVFLLWARIKGYSFKLMPDSDLDNVYHLRWKIYSDEGYINPEDYPDHMFKDKYEQFSKNIVAFYKNEMIGTVRLTFNSVIGIPTLNNFNVVLPSLIKSLNDIVEIGRFMILPQFRGKNRDVAFGLSAFFYLFLMKKGMRWWIVHMPVKLQNSFKKFGVSFEMLEEKELLPKHIDSRGIIAGYFDKHELKPMIADMYKISKW